MRLGKALALAGVASRRKSEDVVFSGRVAVNGEVVMKPETRVTWGRDKIELDGVPLLTPPSSASASSSGAGAREAFTKFHFMLNKPKGYMCSSDESCKKSVLDLFRPWIENYMDKQGREAGRRRSKGSQDGSIEEEDQAESLALPPRLFTVGRLDVATTGLLLVTNDGAWAQEISHPKYGVLKEYVVTCATKVKLAQLEKIAEGTEVENTFVVPKRVEGFDYRTGDPKYEYKVKIVVGEGKKHEVRELVASAGLKVTALKRIRIGALSLNDLPIGKFRGLKKKELELPKKN
ncbi:pseudouridine synthase [Chloropicon primus]|uniref:Pseudouridine synthase n=1 Tax=Chloropicon primus TaxID=1764295 RepID=A0A5B8MM60_9CHLO|nr:pseudouridine synthase [Chloropicon primus]UPR00328.1 pseudouridine synthase [Chloropicon primus]|eukprot:QDZ21114.1 pseudouridine synthase [Chloropicon primus]